MLAPRTIDSFIEDRRARWARLGDLVGRAGGRVARLTADEVLELGRLYRAATSDLAVMRRDYPRDVAAERLNDLVAAGHALVYAERPTSGRHLRTFAGREVPAAVRAARPFIAVSAALLFGSALISYGLGLLFPDVAVSAMSEEARNALSRRAPGTEIVESERVVVGPLIIANNVYVSVIAFAGGMTAGALTAFALVNNGLMLGTTFAVLQRYGGADYLATFILAHGPLELSAITLAAAAGLRLAWAMLHPGELSRSESLRLGGAQALRIMALVVATLVLAGVIEAFVSPTTLDLRLKLGVGVVTGALLWAYILKGLPARFAAPGSAGPPRAP